MNDLKFTWKGQDYTVPARGPNGRMTLAAKVEGVITMNQLATAMAENKVPHVTVCTAFSRVLQHVGVKEEPEDVLETLFSDPETMQETMSEMIVALMTLFTPGQPAGGEEASPLASKPKRKGTAKAS